MTRPTTSDPTRRPALLRPGGVPATACFLGVELLLLAAAHLYGGPPWTLLMMLAMLAQVAAGVRLAPLALLVPSLAWLVTFRATGNRELFFPFAMHLATFVALLGSDDAGGQDRRDDGDGAEPPPDRHPPRRSAALLPGMVRGPLGGGGMAAAFLAIRAVQNATARVLAVESVVAMVILAVASAAIATSRRMSPGPRTTAAAAIVLLSSLAAYAALAI